MSGETILDWESEMEGRASVSTTVSDSDLVLFSLPDRNPAYTLVFGVVAVGRPLQSVRPVKYVYMQRPAVSGGRYDVPWFETTEDWVGAPGATVVSLADWPGMWEHPERLNTARNLAELISHFDHRMRADWQAFLVSFSMFLVLHDSPRERFEALAKTWRTDTRFCSDTNEICSHPAYQRIIGMGVLALPFIFAELEKEADQWFWALKAITGADPVPEEDQGDLELMRKAWLHWADERKGKLGSEWERVIMRLGD
jgi:hypothetical protein